MCYVLFQVVIGGMILHSAIPTKTGSNLMELLQEKSSVDRKRAQPMNFLI